MMEDEELRSIVMTPGKLTTKMTTTSKGALIGAGTALPGDAHAEAALKSAKARGDAELVDRLLE